MSGPARNNWMGQGRLESAGESSSARKGRAGAARREGRPGLAWPGYPKNVSIGGKSSSKAENQLSGTEPTEPPEPPLDHPISPHEQRGFPRPPHWQDELGKKEP
jgi:hypothetical protein